MSRSYGTVTLKSTCATLRAITVVALGADRPVGWSVVIELPRAQVRAAAVSMLVQQVVATV